MLNRQHNHKISEIQFKQRSDCAVTSSYLTL